MKLDELIGIAEEFPDFCTFSSEAPFYSNLVGEETCICMPVPYPCTRYAVTHTGIVFLNRPLITKLTRQGMVIHPSCICRPIRCPGSFSECVRLVNDMGKVSIVPIDQIVVQSFRCDDQICSEKSPTVEHLNQKPEDHRVVNLKVVKKPEGKSKCQMKPVPARVVRS